MVQRHIKPVGIVNCKTGDYRIINKHELRKQREKTIENKVKKWQDLYGENEGDFFINQSNLQKSVCTNEILLQEQEDRIGFLERRLKLQSIQMLEYQEYISNKMRELIEL